MTEHKPREQLWQATFTAESTVKAEATVIRSPVKDSDESDDSITTEPTPATPEKP